MTGGSDEKVIELSIDETNKLRAELGLAPLRRSVALKQSADSDSKDAKNADNAVLEMSVGETNALRAKLGLPPLRESRVIHDAPVVPDNSVQNRITQARLQREAQQGAQEVFASTPQLGADTSDASSWAKRIRKAKNGGDKNGNSKSVSTNTDNKAYSADDLTGLNVKHSIDDLQEGATTVLTLEDAPILARKDDHSKQITGLVDDDTNAALENVDLAQSEKQKEGLRLKRQYELGLGRAGGYAGYDDDEFEELGGTQQALSTGRDVAGSDKPRRSKAGFRIGIAMQDDEDEGEELNAYSEKSRQAISLENTQGDAIASDFMTVEEDEALKEKKRKKKEKKDAKFKKKKKKDKKRSSRKKNESDDEDDEEAGNEANTDGTTTAPKSLADELEATVANDDTAKRKRSLEEAEDDNEPDVVSSRAANDTTMFKIESKKAEQQDKRAKYDAVMAKGNERTRQAFLENGTKKNNVKTEHESDKMTEDEPDDSFLDSALAKARRVNKLKEMALKKRALKGADAVLEAVKQSRVNENVANVQNESTNKISFTIDETREFTKALQAKTAQAERQRSVREAASKTQKVPVAAIKEEADAVVVSTVTGDNDGQLPDGEDIDMMDLEALAKEVKDEEDDVPNIDPVTGEALKAVSVGRGVGSVLQLLQQQGDTTRQFAGREELRGRARDERNYEDYEPMDLKKVVKIDESRANAKDREFANREVKLEYRDKHGRLLTRKEAYRDLCYQFNGYGSGKRKEEKKLQQIARERAETRLASEQGADTGLLGALRKTQQASGKAFVVHKT